MRLRAGKNLKLKIKNSKFLEIIFLPSALSPPLPPEEFVYLVFF
jgi:hypothetical protein